MDNKKRFLSITFFLLIAFLIAGCGVIPTPVKGVIEGRVVVPPSAGEMSKDVSGWVSAAGATVTIVDANGVTRTTTTDENGYYSFENIAVNPNTVITATVEVDGKAIVLKKVIPGAVAEDEDYDAGVMTPESTAIGLVVEQLLEAGMDLGDIDPDEIINTDIFTDLVEQVTTAIEEGKDVTEDLDVMDGVGEIAEGILYPDDNPPSSGGGGGSGGTGPEDPVFNGIVSGQIATDKGDVSGTLTGDFDLEIEGSVTGYIKNIATFTGTVTGDIEGDISATINAQGIDTLYGTITGTDAVETVRIVGIFGQTGTEGDFAGQIITGEQLPAVTALSIEGSDVVAVGDTIILSADITPTDATNEVLWSVYVNQSDIAEIGEKTGELTGLSAGTATVIVKTYDDSNLSFATKQITVVDGKVINVTQKLGYDTIQAAVNEAEDGDEIEIAAGTYDEEVTINAIDAVKSITLRGANANIKPTTNISDGTIITGGIYIGTDASAVIEKSVTIKGITFDGGKGLLLGNIQSVLVENNKFLNITDTFNSSTTNVAGIAVIDPYADGITQIQYNYIDGVAGSTEGLGIYIRKPSSVQILFNNIRNTAHNAILLSGTVTDAHINILGNDIVNWDADNDTVDVGGRALRSAVAASSFNFTENCMIKDTWAEPPVDPNFVKVTGLSGTATVDFGGNYWNSPEPDFSVILNGSDSYVLDSIDNYYSDEGMITTVNRTTG